jgi:hypothetical protein
MLALFLGINFPFSSEDNNPKWVKHSRRMSKNYKKSWHCILGLILSCLQRTIILKGRRMIKNYKKGCLLDELSLSVENNNLEERLSRKIRSLNFANVFTLPWFLVKI